MANIILVDDHRMIVETLQFLIEGKKPYNVVAKFLNAEDFLKVFYSGSLKYDILIFDIKLPDLTGIELAKKVIEFDPAARIMLLSQYKNKEFVISSLKIGILAYILKNCSADELLEAIECVLRGDVYLCKEIILIDYENKKNTNDIHITEREKEVLKLIVNGLTNKEIAQRLFIETDSVEFHKRNLRQKLNVNKSVELAVKAIELGFVNLN